MAAASVNYWIERNSLRYQRDAARVLTWIAGEQARVKVRLAESPDGIINAFARSYGLSREDAESFLANPVSKAEYDMLLETIAAFQGDKNSAEWLLLNARASSAAAAYRLSRAEMAHIAFDAGSASIWSTAGEKLSEGLKTLYGEAYLREMFSAQRTSGHLFPVAEPSEWLTQMTVNAPWNGSDFSSRIWANKNALTAALDDVLQGGIRNGASAAQMAQALSERMDVSYGRAARLIRTETGLLAQMQATEKQLYAAIEALGSKTGQEAQDAIQNINSLIGCLRRAADNRHAGGRVHFGVNGGRAFSPLDLFSLGEDRGLHLVINGCVFGGNIAVFIAARVEKGFRFFPFGSAAFAHGKNSRHMCFLLIFVNAGQKKDAS